MESDLLDAVDVGTVRNRRDDGRKASWEHSRYTTVTQNESMHYRKNVAVLFLLHRHIIRAGKFHACMHYSQRMSRI